ncbi:MAG: NADPH-dependent FMN reductase [Candidatus Methylomirabilales bacterium]
MGKYEILREKCIACLGRGRSARWCRPPRVPLDAELVIDACTKDPNIALRVIDPAPMRLPLPRTGEDFSATRTLRATVAQASGVVLATPEYHGSYHSYTIIVV